MKAIYNYFYNGLRNFFYIPLNLRTLTVKAGAEWILNSAKDIKFLYMLGADGGRIKKGDLTSDAFVVYQG